MVCADCETKKNNKIQTEKSNWTKKWHLTNEKKKYDFVHICDARAIYMTLRRHVYTYKYWNKWKQKMKKTLINKMNYIWKMKYTILCKWCVKQMWMFIYNIFNKHKWNIFTAYGVLYCFILTDCDVSKRRREGGRGRG